MLSRSQTFIKKFAPALAVAVLLFAGRFSGSAEEPAKKQEPEKNAEPAKEEHKNLLDYRVYRPGDSILNSSDSKGSGFNLPPSRVPNPGPSRRDMERLDREKNWVFVLPGDETKDASTKSILGVDSAFDDGKPKSAITKFLERPSAFDSRPDANAIGINPDPLKNIRGSSALGFESQTPNRLDTSEGFGGQAGNLFGGPRGQSLPEQWQALHGPQAEKMREEKRVQMNEFESLFTPQNIAPQNNNNSPAGNYLSSDLDAYRRNTPSSSDAFRNPATTGSAGLPIAPSIDTRIYSPPTQALRPVEPVRRVEQPIVLPIPRRHF